MFDPRVGGVKWHAIQKLTTFSESQHETTMKNAWEHEKTQFLFKILGLVPPLVIEYITDTKSVTTRKNVTKFRLSNHKLLIEVGRHQGLEANERFCPFCTHSVEDEMHFIFECSIYKDQRNRFLVPITSQIHNFSFLPRDQKFELVMCSMDENVCNFISNSMEIREFLMSKPRVNA